MLKDAPILLLDEATAALDAKSEQQVRSALQKLQAGRTTLVVAHHLATVRNADLILVLEDGRITEEGTHDTYWQKAAFMHGYANYNFSITKQKDENLKRVKLVMHAYLFAAQNCIGQAHGPASPPQTGGEILRIINRFHPVKKCHALIFVR